MFTHGFEMQACQTGGENVGGDCGEEQREEGRGGAEEGKGGRPGREGEKEEQEQRQGEEEEQEQKSGAPQASFNRFPVNCSRLNKNGCYRRRSRSRSRGHRRHKRSRSRGERRWPLLQLLPLLPRK